MDESGRHQELWRQLHREVIRGLEEELELLRIRESDLQRLAQEREIVLLELLEVERASRLAAETGTGTGGAPDEQPGPGDPPRSAAASARAAESALVAMIPSQVRFSPPGTASGSVCIAANSRAASAVTCGSRIRPSVPISCGRRVAIVGFSPGCGTKPICASTGA